MKIIFSWLNKPSTNRKITISLIILSFILSIVTFLVFSNSLPYIETTPVIAMITLSTDVVLLFALCFKVIRKIVQTWIERKKGIVGAKIYTYFCFISSNTYNYACYFFFSFFQYRNEELV